MELTSFTEVRNTREKLRKMERLYEEQSKAPALNPFARELTLKSIQETIKQFKEEIARFESRACPNWTEIDAHAQTDEPFEIERQEEAARIRPTEAE